MVSPLDGTLPSAVENFVAKQPCTPYHVCWQVDDLTVQINRLRKLKFKQLGEILTTDVYGYTAKGVFMFGLSIGLIELVQEL